MGERLRQEVGETLILVSEWVARYPMATGHGSRLETGMIYGYGFNDEGCRAGRCQQGNCIESP